MDSWSKSENVYHYIPLVTVLSNPDVRYFPVNKSESRSWNHSNKNSPILPRNLIFSLSFLFFFIFIVESISRWIDFGISLWDPSKKIIEILSNKNDSILLDFLFDFLLFGIRVNVIYIYIFERERGWTLYAETEFQVSSLQASAITSRATAREKRETGLRATVLQQIKFSRKLVHYPRERCGV